MGLRPSPLREEAQAFRSRGRMRGGSSVPQRSPPMCVFDSCQVHFLSEFGHVVAETGTTGQRLKSRVGKPACRDFSPLKWVFCEAENKASLVEGWEADYRVI